MKPAITTASALCPRCHRRAIDGCASWCHRMPAGFKLRPVLIRMPPEQLQELHELVERTRIHQADYLREAVADLLKKYRVAKIAGAA